MLEDTSKYEFTILSLFSTTFVIHTDVSKLKLGAIISHDDKPITLYSRKLNP